MEVDPRYQALFDRSNDAIFLIDFNQVFRAVNQKTTELLGYDRDELIGMSIQDIIAPEEFEQSRLKKDAIFAGEIPPIYERTFIRKDDKRVIGEVSAMVVYDLEGNPEFIQSIVRDVTEKKSIEHALLDRDLRYRSLFEQTNDGITLINLNGTILDANPRAAEIIGYTLEELIGHNVDDFLTQDEPLRSAGLLARLIKGEKLPIYERILVKKDGSHIPVEVNIVLVKDQLGNPLYFQAITRDISERKQIEEKLEYMSTHDWLTGLPNRFLLYDRMEKAIARGKRYQRKFAVLYIDLDGFKRVNDSMGHDAGDLVLIEVTRRLVGCLRESDTIARMGGDEFVMLVEEITGHEDAITSARRVLDQIHQNYSVNGTEVSVSASIGISIYPDHGQEDEILVKCADRALYKSKQGEEKFTIWELT